MITTVGEIILDMDNVLVLGDYKILGKIQDIFGSVSCPHYIVFVDRYLKDMSQKNELLHGMEVFVLSRLEKFINQDVIN